MKAKYSLLFMVFFCSGFLYGQVGSEPVWPGKVLPTDSMLEIKRPGSAMPVFLSRLNESDVKYRKRVWRRLDMRQKLNNYFTWQGTPLNQVLYETAVKGKTTAYISDSLQSKCSQNYLNTAGSYLVVRQINNWRNPNDPTDLVDTTYMEKFDWKKMVKLELMEDWIWDNVRGEYAPVIIAIAPITANKEGKDVPMYWLKMADLEKEFKLHYVQTRDGAASKLTWYEVFSVYRLYDGIIVKTSSSGGGYINGKPEYMQNGEAALLEADHLMNDLFIFEHDLWEY